VYDTAWLHVVGVVADIRHNPNAGGEAVRPTLHLPHAQAPARAMAVLVTTAGDPNDMAAAIGRTVVSLDPAIAPGEVRTMERVVHNALAPQRTTARMLAIFGIIAVVLASIGTYGVIAYSVRQRTDELAIRMALGAGGGDISRLVLRQGGTLVAAGLALGLIGALGLGWSMRAIMFEVGTFDPLAFLAASATVALVGMLACWLPARRAGRSEPARLLRGP
jgi:putative ABC transport system permease protein